jgi:hypothetical protein
MIIKKEVLFRCTIHQNVYINCINQDQDQDQGIENAIKIANNQFTMIDLIIRRNVFKNVFNCILYVSADQEIFERS